MDIILLLDLGQCYLFLTSVQDNKTCNGTLVWSTTESEVLFKPVTSNACAVKQGTLRDQHVLVKTG